jgi:hypothetical protein
MSTVVENKGLWNDTFSWESGGHEWSAPWDSCGSWSTAPGFGRWTPYLISSSEAYVGLDISERCITHCRRTFGPLPSRPKFFQCNGISLDGVSDASVSLAFSFDSLVHAEIDCLAAYAAELFRTLEPGGYAFLHHSNLGEYVIEGELSVPHVGWRGLTVTEELVRDTFRDCGFISIAHEKIKWAFNGPFSDCFTLVRKPCLRSSAEEAPRETVFYNDRFSEELAAARYISARYTSALADN